MSIPSNITKEHLLAAISKIDKDGIPKDGDSQYYDVIFNEKRYPPKIVVSYANIFANGKELDRNTFSGGLNTQCFKLLEASGFIIVKKSTENSLHPNFWVEKTIVEGRNDRKSGDRALGIALWSPQRDKGGADIYKNMRLVEEGDIVLHLIDNKYFSGVSRVKKKFIETSGLVNTAWDAPSYLIELHNYTELNPKIDRAEILNEQNRNLLKSIADKSEVFYNIKLNLREGAYITPCSYELLKLINDIYIRLSRNNLPLTDNISFEKINDDTMTQFDLNILIENFAKANLKISDKLITRFSASLLSKPFLILTGLSGSGKTKLAQAFAMWLCKSEEQYCIVPVGADWTNREPLLGFPNALEQGKYVKPDNKVLDLIIAANDNITKPYFLILDEMNLSHVERYFADFLSVMESKGKFSLHSGEANWGNIPSEIGLPKNLFIIGTVNIDETTYMFSPKVLDRANVIEFRVTAEEMDSYLSKIAVLDLDSLQSAGANMANSFVEIAINKSLSPKDPAEIQKALMTFFTELKKTGAEFGYRSAAEIFRFAAIINSIDPDWTTADIIDAAIMQKLLPKVHGSRRKLEPILKTLGGLCLSDGEKIDDYISSTANFVFEKNLKIKYPISFEKILRMYQGLLDNSFTSYAEA